MHGIIAVITEDFDLWQMAAYALVGFALVMVVLLILTFFMFLMGVLFQKTIKIKSPFEIVRKGHSGGQASAAAEKPEGEQVFAGVPKDHEYVISAAVAAMLPELKNEGAELLAVLSAAAAVALEEEGAVVYKAPDFTYSREGRLQVFASKVIIPQRAARF